MTKLGAWWHQACFSRFRGSLHFVAPLQTGKRLRQGQSRSTSRDDLLRQSQHSPFQQRPAASSSQGWHRKVLDALRPVEELGTVVVMGLLCSCNTHMYRTSCSGAAQQCAGWQDACSSGMGRTPSAPFPEQVPQCCFVRQGQCPCGEASGRGGVATCPGELLRRISQTTHLSLASLRLGSHSQLSLQAHRGDKLFPVSRIDKSFRTTRRARSWLPGGLRQETRSGPVNTSNN